jgi:hypothetical protein
MRFITTRVNLPERLCTSVNFTGTALSWHWRASPFCGSIGIVSKPAAIVKLSGIGSVTCGDNQYMQPVTVEYYVITCVWVSYISNAVNWSTIHVGETILWAYQWS